MTVKETGRTSREWRGCFRCLFSLFTARVAKAIRCRAGLGSKAFLSCLELEGRWKKTKHLCYRHGLKMA